MQPKKLRKLLYELDRDSRQSLPQLSKKTNMSEQVVSYNIANLQKKGIIKNFFTVIRVADIGFTSYRIHIQLSRTDKKMFQNIIGYFEGHSNVLWLARAGGRFDLIVDLMARNIIEFDNQLNGIRREFSEQIQNYTILTIVDVLYLGRSYLIDKKREPEKILTFGNVSLTVNLDEIDRRILSCISEDARVHILDVAKRLSVSGNTVSNRMKNMRKSGIIQGFKPLIHLERIGVEAYKIIIKLHNTTIDGENRLFAYAQMNSNIVFYIKTVGEWDIEMEAEVESGIELQNIVMGLRDAFSDMIKEIETIPIYHDYRYNYVPGSLLQ